MSPQLREAYVRGSPYNAFKADVFALGASLLHMATLTSPYALVTAESMQEAVGMQVEALACSALLKHLIRSMLAHEEDARPTMLQVCDALVQQEEVKRSPIPAQLEINIGGRVEPAPVQHEEVKFSPSPTNSTSRQKTKGHHRNLKSVQLFQTDQLPPVPPEEVKLSTTPTRAKLGHSTGGRIEAFKSTLPSQTNQLVNVTESSILFFDFQTETWREQPLNLHVQAHHNSSWVMLEGGSVFICGGGYDLNTAYIVGDRCTEQGRMFEARCWHGMLAYNNAVYVFGGYRGGRLNSCEKYHLQQHTWTLLPSMKQARYHFNPCLFHENIFLCGDWSPLLEAFSPQRDQMLPFQLSMPVDVLSPCCMYVEDNCLVVHFNHNILKYRVEEAKKLVQTSRSITQERVMWQNSQPVVDEVLRLYYIVQNGNCYCVNMDTGVAVPVTR